MENLQEQNVTQNLKKNEMCIIKKTKPSRKNPKKKKLWNNFLWSPECLVHIHFQKPNPFINK